MSKYLGLIIWIVVFVLAIIIVKLIFKKITSLIITIIIMILTGSIPYSSVKNAVTVAQNSKTMITTYNAALWRTEVDDDGDKTLYLLGKIPIELY
jgi:hypothetical protein